MIGTMFGALAAGRTRLRRARNLRAGARGHAQTGRQARGQWRTLVALVANARASLNAVRLRAGQALARRPDARSTGSLAAPPAAPPTAGTSTRTAMPSSARLGRRADSARSHAGAHAALPAVPDATSPAALRLAAGCLLLALAGACAIAIHARKLAAVALAESGGETAGGEAVLQPALAGAAFTVPTAAGVRVEVHRGATLLLVSGMQAEPARRVDLCSQLADPAAGTRLLPLRAGLRFADVAGLVARGQLLRNAMLASEPMPLVTITGDAAASTLALRWQGEARWVGDGVQRADANGGANAGVLARQGWLVWGGDRALRIVRRPSSACPRAGELVLQLFHPTERSPDAASSRALAIAFPADGGAAVETRLAPGSYRVPLAPPAALEDQQLFAQLRARGLLRLGRDGMLELAPPDLPAWRAQGTTPWDDVAVDDATRKLLDHLYRRADGDFVREQVRIFNAERKLLAWRVQDGDVDAGAWRAEAAGAPVPLAADMPAAASRLFDRLPQGWAPWRRVADWPAGAAAARIALPATAARPGQPVRVMLAGRFVSVTGARLVRAPEPACSGRACMAPGDVQVLDLVPEPGAQAVTLEAAPLPMDALATPGDARYRHIVLRDGQPVWQAQAMARSNPRATANPAAILLADRAGAPLWHDGEPTEAARTAGLAALLGVRSAQESGVAGMLARLPGPDAHTARLTIDLALQREAQAALDCIAMRRGRWDGGACAGAQEAPAGRQAGVVLLDAETGAILAAAGAGNPVVDAANWREARDFDRLDPAGSPLRLPAWQHDGGAERSPGSTFKIVSALGLELAATRDRRLDALLDGRPLADINAMAAAGGWAFRTDAPTYPAQAGGAGHGARITNFRDQGLDRRAQDGRLGVAQALTYSLNTWFAWTGELADASLSGTPQGGAPDLQPLAPDALDEARPIVAMARRLGFGQPLRLDGGLLPPDYAWGPWDALQATPAAIDPVHTRHEVRQMAIGLRMQATPLQMALVAAAVGQGRVVTPHLLDSLDGRAAQASAGAPLGVRLDRIRAGLKGVVDTGTAASAFRGAGLEAVRRGLSGKTGTAPLPDERLATVWFTGWLEPNSLPGQAHRLAVAVFVSRSEATGGEHAAPVAAAVLRALAQRPVR